MRMLAAVLVCVLGSHAWAYDKATPDVLVEFLTESGLDARWDAVVAEDQAAGVLDLREAFPTANESFFDLFRLSFAEEASLRRPEFEAALAAHIGDLFDEAELGTLLLALRSEDPESALAATAPGSRFARIDHLLLTDAEQMASRAMDGALDAAVTRTATAMVEGATGELNGKGGTGDR